MDYLYYTSNFHNNDYEQFHFYFFKLLDSLDKYKRLNNHKKIKKYDKLINESVMDIIRIKNKYFTWDSGPYKWFTITYNLQKKYIDTLIKNKQITPQLYDYFKYIEPVEKYLYN